MKILLFYHPGSRLSTIHCPKTQWTLGTDRVEQHCQIQTQVYIPSKLKCAHAVVASCCNVESLNAVIMKNRNKPGKKRDKSVDE